MYFCSRPLSALVFFFLLFFSFESALFSFFVWRALFSFVPSFRPPFDHTADFHSRIKIDSRYGKSSIWLTWGFIRAKQPFHDDTRSQCTRQKQNYYKTRIHFHHLRRYRGSFLVIFSLHVCSYVCFDLAQNLREGYMGAGKNRWA